MNDATDVIFGENVFSPKTMRQYLSGDTWESLRRTAKEGAPFDPAIADEVACAMKTWAMSKGATHYTHWFQPLTGATAEKHDSFFTPDYGGGVIAHFSGNELVQGEPDASSFPNGGLRATFEARGYTAWDPTSPAFVRKGPNSVSVLCIPTIFCGYNGEALDNKTPLLRSQVALANQVSRMAKLFNVPLNQRPYATLGAEQEYFLIDKKFFDQRIDLIQTGRTLFGRRPARHQQMEDHYFGLIQPRILAFMAEVDRELWRVGVPAKTRHNEVSPGQFEIAPVFEEQNLACDNNMITMQVLNEVAGRHGLVCLLHEKPFAGVNGSGKHNNWTINGPDGTNWLSPGKTPHENAIFLAMLCAVIRGVDVYAPLLRAACASAGNDHRLGANEAPPAIVSIFLGEQLSDIINQIEKGKPTSSKGGGKIEIGVSSLPELPRDVTDRNRTSPMAFTGNKFELRAVGSGQPCSPPNTVLNLLAAASLDELCSDLEAALEKGEEFNGALQAILSNIVKKHKRVIFDGDGYTEAWRKEAARRGLPNLVNTPEALEVLKDPKMSATLENYGILTRREVESRYEIHKHTYEHIICYESECALLIARTQIHPAIAEWQSLLAESVVATAGLKAPRQKKALAELVALHENLLAKIDALDNAVESGNCEKMTAASEKLRVVVDDLEGIVPDHMWPLPSYGDMFYLR